MTFDDHSRPFSFKPYYDNPKAFVTSEWQTDKGRASPIYYFIKLAIFIIFFVVWILTIAMESRQGQERWPIYLTNWGFTMCLFQSGLSCIMLGVAVLEDFPYHYNWTENFLKLYPAYWVLNVMATSVAFTITLVYWTLIYSVDDSTWSLEIREMNFMVHGCNSILMFLEFWMASHPVRLLHAVYPFMLGLTYITMTAIFYVAGGTTKDGSRYIYPILKWDEPGTTILYCIGIMALMVVIHLLTFIMYKLRQLIVPPMARIVQNVLKCC